jgi:Tfp pilus assembly protein PilF
MAMISIEASGICTWSTLISPTATMRSLSNNLSSVRPVVRAIVIACAIALSTFAANAVERGAPAGPFPSTNPKVAGLFYDARTALRADDIRRALLDLKLAVGMEPANSYVMTELGIAFNQGGSFANAEDTLRRARSLGASDEMVLGPLFEAMLARNENQALLDLFPDPASSDLRPLAATVLRARAAALEALQDEVAAQSAMERSLAIRRDFDGLMTAARIAYRRENWGDANRLMDEALKLAPGNSEARVFKIGVALKEDDETGALAIAEQLVADKPRSLTARLARIRVYLSTGLIDKAKQEVDRLLSRQSDLIIANYYRAIILARRGNVSAAWSVAHALPAEFVQSRVDVSVNVANMALGAGFLDSAATILNAAVFANPRLLELRLELAEIRLRQQSPQYALNALAVVEDSKDPRVAVLFARAYMMSKRPAVAQRYIDRAIEQGGGELLTTLGKEIAVQSMRDWISHHPDNLLVRRQYAHLLLRLRELAGAREQYEQLAREHPDDAVALNNLSWLVFNESPARALSLARRAVQLVPGSADYWDTLGCMQLRQRDASGALTSLRRAHQLRERDSEVTFHLAMALDANRARPAAKALLATLVSRDDFADRENARRLLAAWR